MHKYLNCPEKKYGYTNIFTTIIGAPINIGTNFARTNDIKLIL